METLEFTRIESVKGTMPGGIGSIVRYSVEMISDPALVECLGDTSVRQAILLDVNVLAGQGIEYGEFISSAILPGDDGEPVMVAFAGTYAMEPDYNLLRRIIMYRHNHSATEAVTPEDFREAYGQAFGGHYYDKWMWLEQNIAAMIGYFGSETDNGQTFIGLLMKRVRQYEKRLNARK